MRKIFLIITIIFLGFQGQSQERIKNFNQWTLDATYGLSIPFGSSKVSYNPDAASFISFTNVTIGGRYNFTEDWGVATHMTIVGYHGDGIGTNNFRLDAQAYYNLGRLTGLLSSSNEKFGLLAHSGFGVTWSKSLVTDKKEHMGNFIIGLSPIYKVNKKIAILADLNYTANFKQHFQFDGVYYQPASEEYKTGNLFNFGLGVIFYLGDKDLNADWK